MTPTQIASLRRMRSSRSTHPGAALHLEGVRELLLGLVCLVCLVIAVSGGRGGERCSGRFFTPQAELRSCDQPASHDATPEAPVANRESNTDDESDDLSDEAPDEVSQHALHASEQRAIPFSAVQLRRLISRRLLLTRHILRGRPADAPEAKPPRA